MKYKCPCCGYYTLEEKPGSYEICPVCFWEEDPTAEQQPNIAFGGNNVSLNEARRNFQIMGACDDDGTKHVRKPLPEEKDPLLSFTVERAETLPQRAGAYYVRIHGMNRQHHIPLEEEFDGKDTPETKYIIMLDDGYPMATIRLNPISETELLISRLVVLPEYRKMGIARKMIREAEIWSKEMGIRTMIMDARCGLEEYYASMGYVLMPEQVIHGPTFTCVRMEKEI